jgi:hypothetical protein
VRQASLPDLLEFLVQVGSITCKRVALTPENVPDVPIFDYDPHTATEPTTHGRGVCSRREHARNLHVITTGVRPRTTTPRSSMWEYKRPR